jgi:hypothetical protein
MRFIDEARNLLDYCTSGTWWTVDRDQAHPTEPVQYALVLNHTAYSKQRVRWADGFEDDAKFVEVFSPYVVDHMFDVIEQAREVLDGADDKWLRDALARLNEVLRSELEQ